MKRRIFVLQILLTFVIACSPKIQPTGGLRAPADIKIDGILSEWPGGKLQASNTDARIEYTICNDDDNLYLAIRSAGNNAIDKFLYKGVTFTINSASGSAAENSTAITFPLLDYKDASTLSIGAHNYLHQRYRNDSSSRVSGAQLNAILSNINKQAIVAQQSIKVTGIKAIKDSILSIKKNSGINAAALFDKRACYVYELAIPLKLIGLNVKNANRFSYSIKMKGLFFQKGSVEEITRYLPKENRDPDFEYIRKPISISGEYTLAR